MASLDSVQLAHDVPDRPDAGFGKTVEIENADLHLLAEDAVSAGAEAAPERVDHRAVHIDCEYAPFPQSGDPREQRGLAGARSAEHGRVRREFHPYGLMAADTPETYRAEIEMTRLVE